MNGRLQREQEIDARVESKLRELPEYVCEWYFNMKASRKTAATREQYITNIKHFLSFINPDVKNVKLRDINQSAIRNFYLSIQTTEKNGEITYTSDSYQISTWYCLNNFFEFLIDSDLITKNYMRTISKPKNRDLDRINEHRILLKEDDFRKILGAVDKEDDKFIRVRDYAMLLVFMNTGIRRAAMSTIMKRDVDLENHLLYVVDKGNKRHEYVLGDKVVKSISDWLEIRRDKNPSLFVSRRGNTIDPSTIAYSVRKYTEEALGKAISPHKLRSGYCSILYGKTHDIEFVRRCVGHSNATTTQRYIVTNGSEKQKAAEIFDDLL